MQQPANYAEKVYAGVLGKVIGVFVGQPIEGWSQQRIESEIGDVTWYTNDKVSRPLVVSDDDIAGTFTFIRAIDDHRAGRNITAEQIGLTWLNYLIEYENTLCWSGLGRGSEHTAFLRLKAGIPAPRSGSTELNGTGVSEQIGSQIFIDGWAMVAPGDPDLAADLARRGASVSHDGIAVHAAQSVAAMESLAFVENDMGRLLDCGLRYVPTDSLLHRLYGDIRNWAAAHGDDWRKTFARVQERYPASQFRIAGQIVPDHAIMVMAWAHARDSFDRAMTVCGTAGGDTDCNLGNVGCLMGIKLGLAAFNERGRDWREPFADRVLIPTAPGFTDCLRLADMLVKTGQDVMGFDAPPPAKKGARLHFSMPGALHGFMSEDPARVRLDNTAGRLRIAFDSATREQPAVAVTPVGMPPDMLARLRDCYGAAKYPAIFSGQLLTASLVADAANTAPVRASLLVRYYTDMSENTRTAQTCSKPVTLAPAQSATIAWTIPDTGGLPIYNLAVAIDTDSASPGAVELDWLHWTGSPRVNFPDAIYRTDYGYPYGWTISGKPFRHIARNNTVTMIQANEGSTTLSTGLSVPDWRNYAFRADLTLERADEAGILARFGGQRRYLALVFNWDANELQLVRRRDDKRRVLARTSCEWSLGATHNLRLEVKGQSATGLLDGKEMLRARFQELSVGGVGLLVTLGSASFARAAIAPLE